MAYLLIADDDLDFAQAVGTVLQSRGYEIQIETDPDQVVGRIRERRPDAVILDVMFPENDTAGFDLARLLGRTFDDLPVLMLTAVNQRFPLGFSSQDIDEVWLPVADFVEKPVDLNLLCAKVDQLLATAR